MINLKMIVCTFKLQNGESYISIIELQEPNIHAFVLKDGSRDRWLASFSGLPILLIWARGRLEFL